MPNFDWLRARAVLHNTKELGVLNYSVMTAFTYIILNERSSMEYDAVMYSHCSGMEPLMTFSLPLPLRLT